MTEETGFADEGEGARQALLALAADLDVEARDWAGPSLARMAFLRAARMARQRAEAIPPPPDTATRAFFAGNWDEGLD